MPRSTPFAGLEEAGEDLGDLVGRFLGNEVAAGDAARGEVVGPGRPDVGASAS
jgi:hypothetical protein